MCINSNASLVLLVVGSGSDLNSPPLFLLSILLFLRKQRAEKASGGGGACPGRRNVCLPSGAERIAVSWDGPALLAEAHLEWRRFHCVRVAFVCGTVSLSMGTAYSRAHRVQHKKQHPAQRSAVLVVAPPTLGFLEWFTHILSVPFLVPIKFPSGPTGWRNFLVAWSFPLTWYFCLPSKTCRSKDRAPAQATHHHCACLC